jgi:uncharacterized membrane protein
MEASNRPVAAVVRGEARHRDEWDVEFNRIVAFSDAVFAIAITLLVLALEVPEHSEDVWNGIVRQRGDLLAYALSFAVLGKLWIAHHRFFSVLDRFDGRLMGLNLLYLAFVAIVPYTSNVLGDYGEQTPAVILYAVGMFGVSLTFSVQIAYATRAGLVRSEVGDLEKRYAGPASFLTAIVFLASIPVAVLSPGVATLMWLLIFVVGDRIVDWLGGVLDRR